MTDAQKLDLLCELIRKQGFELVEGDFIRKDGSFSPYFLRPVDAQRLLYLAMKALSSKEDDA